MLASEPIADANVAAFYVYHCCFRVVVSVPAHPHLSPWGRLFTWSPWSGDLPARAIRVGRTLYMTPAFRERVDFYVNSYRTEAKDRLALAREGFRLPS